MPQNGQFQYPTSDWAAGTMRKVGDPGSSSQYDTQLSEAEEVKFQEWKQKHAPNDSGEDYDLRGAFKAGLKPDPDTGHWPDLYKKPNHPTFSDQSIYAKDRPDLAGHWEGDTYVPPQGKRSGLGMQMAKMLPTSQQAGQVVVQGAGRARGKRKEAEAM